MRRNDENPAADDALDRAIRDALHVELEGHEVENLEHYWRVQLRRETWRRHAVALFTAAAAMIAVVAGLLLVRSRERGHEVVQISEVAPADAAVRAPISPPRMGDGSLVTKPSASAGRDATPYEQLVFASRTRINVRPDVIRTAIDAAIRRLAANPDGSAAEIVTSFGLKPANAELLLLR